MFVEIFWKIGSQTADNRLVKPIQLSNSDAAVATC